MHRYFVVIAPDDILASRHLASHHQMCTYRCSLPPFIAHAQQKRAMSGPVVVAERDFHRISPDALGILY